MENRFSHLFLQNDSNGALRNSTITPFQPLLSLLTIKETVLKPKIDITFFYSMYDNYITTYEEIEYNNQWVFNVSWRMNVGNPLLEILYTCLFWVTCIWFTLVTIQSLDWSKTYRAACHRWRDCPAWSEPVRCRTRGCCWWSSCSVCRCLSWWVSSRTCRWWSGRLPSHNTSTWLELFAMIVQQINSQTYH